MLILVYLLGLLLSGIFVSSTYLGLMRFKFKDWWKYFVYTDFITILLCTVFSWVGLIGFIICLKYFEVPKKDIIKGLELLIADLESYNRRL